ncbi:hypothetical protein Terro_3796 [Terriglobus roseus DSM 18391]|uniref:TonB-dependent transporter Oar-like beta-barrel domain-containing protein n=1 Tax=Terriglobus roseus (strain DSM 18391 / NRRL B-41598 / KBS 63) TaxID=926566 RepID=I3ZL87_TERRK|nr:TonB-dependent receptor [Terriglobus roseus]AFL90005.1 hypothetical protein Terro_3796 [Terriglobus roseus DSM 18391]
MYFRRFDVRQKGVLSGLVLLVSSASAMGQASSATVSGVVHDAQDALIARVNLKLVNTMTGTESVSETNGDGVFTIPGVMPGTYSLQVDSPGFATTKVENIVLHVGDNKSLVVRMSVGPTDQSITVEGGSVTVNTTDAVINTVIQEKFLENLPLNGRNAAALLQLAPGAVDLARNVNPIATQGAVYPGEATASVNGSTRTQINYQLDGVSHNDTYLNASLPFPNPDAIQEFALQAANFSAEYGNAGGGVVNIVSKSGTNQIHGSAFEYLRNGSLNAKNYFGTTHDSLHRNQFGVTLGGPVLHDKLFFFGTYQGTRVSSTTASGVTFVPTAAQRTGDFSALGTQLKNPVTGANYVRNQIPVSPVSAYILKFIPLPNGAAGRLTYSGTPQRTTDDQALAKLDYSVGKHRISGHYFFTVYDSPASVATDNLIAATNLANHVKVQTISAIDTYSPSGTLQFTTSFGLNLQRGGSGSSAPFGMAEAGAKISEAAPPELDVRITSGFTLSTNHRGTFNRGDLSVRESVTKVMGAHELHFGGQALRVSNTIDNTFLQSGRYTYNGQLTGNGLADFVTGRVQTMLQGGGEFKDFSGVQWSLFAQDNWRATSRLTLNAGLRWDPWLPYYDRQGRVVCYTPSAKSVRYPNAPVGVTFGGDDHDASCPKAGSDAFWAQLGPRLGLAYRLTNDGKTSLRAGFGMYYTPIQSGDYNGMADTAPFSPQYTLNNVDVADPYAGFAGGNPFPAQYGPTTPTTSAAFTLPVQIKGSFAKKFRPPVTESWNLAVERQLDSSSFARISYVGNRGYHLSESQTRELNPAIYNGAASTTGNTNARRANTLFGSIAQLESSSNSNYNALQVAYEKRMHKGLLLLVNYSWAKSLDDLGWSSPYSRTLDYGPSAGDVTNNLKFSAVWEIPGYRGGGGLVQRLTTGWKTNGIVVWQSGFPLTVLSGADRSFSGVGRDHAQYNNTAVTLDQGRGHAAKAAGWFNTAAFAPNTVGTFGNSPKGQFRSPRYFNSDFSIVKDTHIAERMNFQLRGEVFNLLNNVNFAAPNVTQNSAQFGTITSALDPRILQLSAKITF